MSAGSQPPPPPVPDPAPSLAPSTAAPEEGESSASSASSGPALPVEHIARHEMLSPVSPHPLHIAEPSAIPVLKNQMDPAFNSTDAHVPESGGGSEPAPGAPDTAAPPQHHRAPYPAERQPPPLQPGLQPSLMDSAPPAAAIASPMDTSLDNHHPPTAATNGDALPAHGHGSSVPALGNGAFAAPAEANATHAFPAGLPNAPAFPASSLGSSVDLQALINHLSPSLPPPQPAPPGTAQTGVTAAALPPPPASASAAQTLTSPTQSAPGVQPRSTNASPITSKPPPGSLTHPLPRPPPQAAPSAVPAHIAAGYPASLPPPPNFAQHKKSGSRDLADDHDDAGPREFNVDEEEEYSRFLNDERDYVTQGQWDRFPNGSRLFIGNLPTEKVGKRDLFHVFNKHGRLAQISIKQAYGFVQFLTQESCASALRNEQGAMVRGRKMHLEISKPQRNTRNAGDPAPRRRSRSPGYGRGERGASPTRRGGGSSYRGTGREVDRFRGTGERRGSGVRDRDDEYDRRSPMARFGERDDYRPSRRSRSRSPPRRYRPRSRSPPPLDVDDVPLPRRAPHEVPEVQILVSDELDRNFIWWVENAFRTQGLKVEMLFLSPRLQLSAVVKRQVLEGVTAVVFLSSAHQTASKCSIQVFKRRGREEATFDQYDNLDPPVAAQLVVREKAAQASSLQPSPMAAYGSYGGTAAPLTQPAAAAAAAAAIPAAGNNLTGLLSSLSSLDPANLNRVLAALQQQQQQAPTQQAATPQPAPLDLSALLGGRQQQSATPSTPQPQQNPYAAAFAQNPGLAALLGRAQGGQVQSPVQAQAPQSAQTVQGGQMQNIMETLAKWKQA